MSEGTQREKKDRERRTRQEEERDEQNTERRENKERQVGGKKETTIRIKYRKKTKDKVEEHAGKNIIVSENVSMRILINYTFKVIGIKTSKKKKKEKKLFIYSYEHCKLWSLA